MFELASLVARLMTLGKLLNLHFHVKKKKEKNLTPHKVVGSTKGTMCEELFAQHLPHSNSHHRHQVYASLCCISTEGGIIFITQSYNKYEGKKETHYVYSLKIQFPGVLRNGPYLR